MIALIPLSDKQYIDKRVFEGLKNQSIPCSPVICIAKGVQNSQGNRTLERTLCEMQSRDLQVQNAMNMTGEFILSIDRDIVLSDPDAVQTMVDCLNENPELGAVGLWFGKGRKITVWLSHVYFKCVLFRREVFSRIDFSKHNMNTCSCNAVKCQIEQMGYKIRYLDFVNRGIEIMYP